MNQLALDDLGGDTGYEPGQLCTVIRINPKTGKRSQDQLEWGLLPHDTKDPERAPRPIHARAETLAEVPIFAGAFAERRALVPATLYFQWHRDGSRRRWAISRADRQLMAWAGLWEGFRWPDGRITRSFCVITIAANASITPIHDRMPLVLEPEDWPLWLGEVPGDPTALLRPPADHILTVNPAKGPR